MEIKESYTEALDMTDYFMVKIFEGLANNHQRELQIISQQYPFEPLQFNKGKNFRMQYPEAIKLMREAGLEVHFTRTPWVDAGGGSLGVHLEAGLHANPPTPASQSPRPPPCTPDLASPLVPTLLRPRPFLSTSTPHAPTPCASSRCSYPLMFAPLCA